MPTAGDFLDLCARDVGKTGDNYVWLGLADEVPDSSLKRWADWDSPYCQGGLQLASIRVGMGLVPCALPYYVPSLEQYARNNGQWVTFANIRPGDWICFDWGGDGIADHVAVATHKPSGSSVRTIEYNTSKDDTGSQSNGRGCWRRTRYSSQIRGAYRPRWTKWSQHGYDLAHWQQTQIDLTTLGRDPGPADGVNGPKTNAAVKAFQSRWNLTRDGIPGPETQAEIRKQLKAQSEPKPKPKPKPTPAPEPAMPDMSKYRMSGPTAYSTAVALERWTPPKGEGVILAARETPDHVEASALEGKFDNVSALPVPRGGGLPGPIRTYLAETRPAWVRAAGGSDVVPDATLYDAFLAAGLTP